MASLNDTTKTLVESKEPTHNSDELEKRDLEKNEREEEEREEEDTEVKEAKKGSGNEKDEDDDRLVEPEKHDGTIRLKSGATVVLWAKPYDPGNPKQWRFNKKWGATAITSAFTFISPVASSMMAPAVGQIGEKFGITNSTELALTVSVFVLAYAFGPLLLGPLSEVYGRSRVLQLANGFFFVFNLACAWAPNKGAFIAFRFLSGLGGSAPLAIGGGLISDVWLPEERGVAMGLYSLGPLLGPTIGPVCGAWIAEKSTYKWVFWSTSILTAVVQFLGLFFLTETYAPVLLNQRAAVLRKSMNLPPDSPMVRTVFQTKNSVRVNWTELMSKSLIRPFELFFKEPIIVTWSVYMAFIYGVIYLVLTTITGIFRVTYGESVGIAGLNYLSLAIGFTGIAQIQARIMDPLYAYLKKRNGGKGEPEMRLPIMVPATIVLPLGLLLFGWAAEKKWHWIVCDIGLAFIAWGMIGNFQCIIGYLVDSFTLYAASALAAVTFFRSLCGFAFPLFASNMYDAVGYGWGNTILAGFAIVVGCPAVPLIYFYGKRIRAASKFAKTS
ncbi:MFS polyamine transporter [Atractiella rhizophila]|nr:MFS polyamine transporter [Atractiella rhizophila]